MRFLYPQGAVVGLTDVFYSITEGDLPLLVCVLVTNPEDEDEKCPVASPFHVRISTVAGSAGIELSDISQYSIQYVCK